MTSFDDELALDRIEATLATELPAHVRAFAQASAEGNPPPPAPAVLHRAQELASRALADGTLASRGLELMRLLGTLAIESDPIVAGIRSTTPSWPAFAGLTAAREAASTRLFGFGHVAWLHWLHGSGWTEPAIVDWPGPLDGWHAPAPAIPHAFVERAWRDLADRHGARGRCRIVSSAGRSRAFVVEPGREVIVAIASITTPAHRFAALHELGHALAALLSPVPLPRVLDEAAASYVARLVEREGDLDLMWHTPLATPARARRLVIAMALDACERGIPVALERPPWALWHDPGAQAAYWVAERFADRWWAELGAAPEPGAFARRLAEEVAHVDRQVLADRALAQPMQPR